MMKKTLLAVLFTLLTCAMVHAAPAPVWETGQKTSYYGGDDGDLERGVAWPVPRFADHGNGTATDNLTGLMWTKNANLPNGYMNWQQALNYVAGMNAGTYPNYGYHDWRLPNRKELFSLIDHSRYNPALPADHPFTNVQACSYWSSPTTRASRGSSVCGVATCTATIGPTATTTFGRCVADSLGHLVNLIISNFR